MPIYPPLPLRKPVKGSEFVKPPKKRKLTQFKQIIPNLVTVFVICCGMTSVRFGVEGRYGIAMMLIVLAAILDAMDGKIARVLDSESAMGAELDSLADFFNFGIAPGILVYSAIFSGTPYANIGWLAVLAVGVCCALRLARFNVDLDQENKPTWREEFFVGVPAPALGCLALLPLFFLMLGYDAIKEHPNFVFVWLVGTGLLAVSTIPTFSIKHAKVNPDHLLLILLACAGVIVSLMTFLWETLIFGCIAYVVSIPLAARRFARLRDEEETSGDDETQN